MFIACNTPEGIDWQLYRALHEWMSLDQLLDVMEMRDVAESWKDARKFNLDRD